MDKINELVITFAAEDANELNPIIEQLGSHELKTSHEFILRCQEHWNRIDIDSCEECDTD